MHLEASHSAGGDSALPGLTGTEGSGRARGPRAVQVGLPLPVSASGMVAPGAIVQRGSERLTPEEFAGRFSAAFRTLWTVAAGVVNNRSVADDIVQEAALTALGKLGEFDASTNFTAWMAKIVRFIALNYARRGQRRPTAVDPATMDGSVSASAADGASRHGRSALPLVDDRGQLVDADRAILDDRMTHALASVGETARACLLLRTLENRSYEEIAALLDIPPGTAMSHVHRTRMLLRKSLADLDPAARSRGRTS